MQLSRQEALDTLEAALKACNPNYFNMRDWHTCAGAQAAMYSKRFEEAINWNNWKAGSGPITTGNLGLSPQEAAYLFLRWTDLGHEAFGPKAVADAIERVREVRDGVLRPVQSMGAYRFRDDMALDLA